MLLAVPYGCAQDDPNYVKPNPERDASSTSDDEPSVILQQDDSGTLEGYGGEWRDCSERIQFLSNITTLRNSPTLFPLRIRRSP